MITTHLILSIMVEVESQLDSLSATITELESKSIYTVGSTPNVKVIATEVLKTLPFGFSKENTCL